MMNFEIFRCKIRHFLSRTDRFFKKNMQKVCE